MDFGTQGANSAERKCLMEKSQCRAEVGKSDNEGKSKNEEEGVTGGERRMKKRQ